MSLHAQMHVTFYIEEKGKISGNIWQVYFFT